MTEDNNLEREFTARVLIHQMGILGGYLMKKYMDNERAKGGETQLPEFTLEEQADKYSEKLIQKYMEEGSFKDHYEVAWSILAPIIPDNTKLMPNNVA